MLLKDENKGTKEDPKKFSVRQTSEEWRKALSQYFRECNSWPERLHNSCVQFLMREDSSNKDYKTNDDLDDESFDTPPESYIIIMKLCAYCKK